MMGFWGLNAGLMGMISVDARSRRRSAGDRELPERVLVRTFVGVLPASR